MSRNLSIDLETRSAIDLKKAGVYGYAMHESAGVWCAGWAIDDGPVSVWKEGEPCPPEIVEHVYAGGRISAWNANFERVLWWCVLTPRYGWPKPKMSQFYCSMVRALAQSLPGSLQNAAAALGLPEQKDMAGNRLAIQMGRPRKVLPDGTLVWWNDTGRLSRLYEYVKQDVETERAASKRLLELSESERRLWWLDQTCNDRGIQIDVACCKAAQKVVESARASLDAEMNAVTNNAVASCNAVAQVSDWIRSRGVAVDSLAKDQLALMLDRGDLPADVRRVLELRQEASKASTAKIAAMLEGADASGRVRGLFQYHGASTGRWAGRRVQPHNLPRDMPKQPVVDMLFDMLPHGGDAVEAMVGPPMEMVSKCLRGFITAAPGKELLVADFNAIEARVLAWLGGQQNVLDAFAGGKDIYSEQARVIYNRPVDRKNNPDDFVPGLVGKVSILALGYAGGIGAFANMAKNYALDMAPIYPVLWPTTTVDEREKAERAYRQYFRRAEAPVNPHFGLASDIVKQRWRVANPRIVALWHELENAALGAVREPGTVHEAAGGRVKYRVAGSFLWCRLPSGRTLCYPYPRIYAAKMPWKDNNGQSVVRDAIKYKGVDSVTRKWGDHALYGGLLAENVTQAAARDLLAAAMFRAEAAGLPVVMHVHDEVVAEVPEGTGDVRAFERLMAEVPAWAAGCPVAAEGWAGRRYRK